MSFRRVFLILVATNIVLALGVFAIRSSERAPVPSEAPATLPQSLEALRERIARRQSGERYTVRLTDAELSSAVAYSMAQQPDIPFANPRVSVTEDRVVLEAATRGFAVPVPVRVTGTVRAAGGIPVVTIQDLSLGSLPIPPAARDQIVAEANKSLDFSRYPLPVTVESIQPGDGETTVTGVIK